MYMSLQYLVCLIGFANLSLIDGTTSIEESNELALLSASQFSIGFFHVSFLQHSKNKIKIQKIPY